MLRNILKYIDYKTRNQILVYQIPSIFQGFLEAIGVFSILPLMIVLIESDKETFFEKFNFLKPFLLDYTFKEIQIIIVACFIIFIIFLNIFISLNFIFSEKIVKNIYTSFFSVIVKKQLTYKNKSEFNTSAAINNLSYNLYRASIHIFRNILRSIPKFYTLLLIFFIMIFVDFEKTLIFISFFLIIYSLIILRVAKNLKIFGENTSSQNENIIRSVKEIFQNIKTVYIDKLSDFFEKKLNFFSLDFAKAENQLQIYTFIIRILVETLAILSICILILFTIFTDQISILIPIVTFYLYAFYRSFPAMQTIFTTYTMYKAWKHTLVEIELIINQNENRNTVNEEKIQFNNEISFKNIFFKYEDNQDYILKNISVDIKKGTLLGIRGNSGSGKTTFLNVLSGLIKPTGGNLEIDGKVLNEKNIYSWFDLVSYLPQRIYLFNSTIEENILLDKTIDHDELKNIINIASLTEFIEEKKFDYKEIIAENNDNLSGGQIQRVGIARALVKKPKVLILDETTSGMQLEMEKNIILKIRKNFPEITIILVTHRKESIKICDEVIELSN